VGEEQERGARAGPGEASDQVRALRDEREELARDPLTLEIGAEVLRRLRLVAGRVDRVQADQALEELDRLVA
jgi:hypothetical protein